jgi:hypothetical protein
MILEYPYQLVAFLDKEPNTGEPVYGGENGWYAQIALKRRFNVADMDEDELISVVEQYCQNTDSFAIKTGGLVQPERMPVRVLEVAPTPELMNFHRNFISLFEDALVSRYPERDGANYLPHITAEYNGEMVIDSNLFSQREFQIESVFLLKDLSDEDSVAYKKFNLRQKQ